MLVSTYIKKPLFKFQNKTMNDYIKQSQKDYINLLFKCNEERKIKKICGLDNSYLPSPPPNKKDIFISTIIFLSLSTTIYYFYSRKK
jgi:hypothetical protein